MSFVQPSLCNPLLVSREQVIDFWSSLWNRDNPVNDTSGAVLTINSHRVEALSSIGRTKWSGSNMFLTSWKAQVDWKSDILIELTQVTNGIDPGSLPQLILYKDQALEWWVGSWTSQKWSGITEITSFRGMFNFSFKNNQDETSFMYEITNDPISQWEWYENQYYFEFECGCLPEFELKSDSEWMYSNRSGGCMKKEKKKGNIHVSKRGRVREVGMREDNKLVHCARANMSLSLKVCKKECMRNCSCIVYTSMNENAMTWRFDGHKDIFGYRSGFICVIIS
ncbi:hypothetical protein L3X38_021139 [Prunus dulcis]|uniref:Apple domain-containing protein n=1 Tax=Prunus dulcis TaxID=3755 RepID=A0AAD4Z3X9_PRUDU|nr:hypothetical protein L3X38_021139 [Prunus dulcis]